MGAVVVLVNPLQQDSAGDERGAVAVMRLVGSLGSGVDGYRGLAGYLGI